MLSSGVPGFEVQRRGSFSIRTHGSQPLLGAHHMYAQQRFVHPVHRTVESLDPFGCHALKRGGRKNDAIQNLRLA